jgi:hypothetical protein
MTLGVLHMVHTEPPIPPRPMQQAQVLNYGSYSCWWVEAFEFEPWLTQTATHST